MSMAPKQFIPVLLRFLGALALTMWAISASPAASFDCDPEDPMDCWPFVLGAIKIPPLE